MSAIVASENVACCRNCAKWFLEWPGDEVALCYNPRSKNYGWATSQSDTCEHREAKAK